MADLDREFETAPASRVVRWAGLDKSECGLHV